MLMVTINVFSQKYIEQYRPQFHFSAENTWLNDPNGMFYYDGEYHLFYQNNPHGTKWGHMSWGHAVSKDLVHWEELPVALNEEDSIAIFSGSAVVDWNNTSGFGKNGNPPIVAIYTGWDQPTGKQYQCIAYSNDKGRSWTKYANNPVLDINSKNFRDPKVIWYEPTKSWIMLLVLAVDKKVQFYNSKNLKDWTLSSEFGPAGAVKGIWECPDLFKLPVNGSNNEYKWVLEVDLGSEAIAGGSGSQYFIGEFNGDKFTSDSDCKPEIVPAIVPEGEIIADFEGSNYGNWTIEGDAFGTSPAWGTLKDQHGVHGYKGKGLVNTFLNHDASTGKLISPEFTINNKFINFLIGGGAHKAKTCINLIIDNKTILSATGNNSEVLSWKSWNVEKYVNQKAKLEIVDKEKGGWGHVNVDHIMMAGSPVIPEHEKAQWLDFGKDYYAAVSWSDVPDSDGRRLWLGWLNNWQYANEIPTQGWRGSMSIPREVKLKKISGEIKVIQMPVKELEKLRAKKLLDKKNISLSDLNKIINKEDIASQTFELIIDVDLTNSKKCDLVLCKDENEETIISYSKEDNKLYFDRTNSGDNSFSGVFSGRYYAPLKLEGNILKLHVFVDKSVVEVFANHGEVTFTNRIFPSEKSKGVEFSSDNEQMKINNIEIWQLKSIWRK